MNIVGCDGSGKESVGVIVKDSHLIVNGLGLRLYGTQEGIAVVHLLTFHDREKHTEM